MARKHGPAVLVAPSDFRAGPWACRSLARAGYRVVGAHTRGLGTGGRSLACPRPQRYPSPLDDRDAFVEGLREIAERESVAAVLPASEDVVAALADQHASFGATIIGPDRTTYDALADKVRLGETATSAGVDHPRTAAAPVAGAVAALPPLPCVVKPRLSGEEMHGAAVAVTVRTEAERAAAIDDLHRAGRDAIVQELLEGARWFGHTVGRGDDFRMLAFEALDDYPRGSGPASYLRSCDAPPGMVETTRRLLDHVRYAGPCSLSFIEKEGRLLVHDVNLRLGATVGASIRAGFDLPRIAVDLALGGPAPAPASSWRHVTYVRLDGELAAAIDEMRGRGVGQSPSRLAARVGRAFVTPGWVLDPSPLDPFAAGTRVQRVLLRAARAQRRRATRRGGAVAKA